jgi:hypothetical protein
MDAVLIREIAEMIGIFVNVLVVLITESSVTRSVKFQKYVTKLMEHADVNPDLLEITVNVSNVDKQSHIFEINARFITNFRFSFWLTKLPKYQNVTEKFIYSLIFLNFCLTFLALQNAKTEQMEMKITQPVFGILVALTKKRTYQNDMKSTKIHSFL